MRAFFSGKVKRRKRRGDVITFALLSVIVAAAVFYTGGVIPHVQYIPLVQLRTGIPIEKDEYIEKKTLQLDTLQFTFDETPEATPPPACSQVTAVGFILDTSRSMTPPKLIALKGALDIFVNQLSNNSVIGMQTFSDEVRQVVPYSLYGEVTSQVQSTILGLQAKNPSATHTRDAFVLAKEKLEEAQQAFPGRKFHLILFTDGIPETLDFLNQCSNQLGADGVLSGDCVTYCSPEPNLRCFDPNQDPTADPDISQEVKDLDVTIYSIALLDSQDTRFNDKLENLLKRVASSEDHFYPAPNPGDLENIYSQIFEELCE